YTSQVEFDFALDIKDERDNLALEQDSAIIRDIAFYSGTCDFDMQCTPLFTDFAERGVATFFQNSGTNLLQAEETNGGLLYTLSMNDKKVTVSQTYPGNLDIYKDALHLQMSTDGTVTGKVLFHDVEIGSLVVLGDQVVFDFFE
ncbi:MAG: hypothetical protein R3309_12170, partial [Reinekea sp.]|nr:hypothetical protein [Reinekea sp.]